MSFFLQVLFESKFAKKEKKITVHRFDIKIYENRINYLNCVVSPSFQMISSLKGHSHDSVISNSKQFISFLSVKPYDKQRHSKIRQRLPSFDEIHFGFQQIQIFDVRVGLKDFLSQLKIVNFCQKNSFTILP